MSLLDHIVSKVLAAAAGHVGVLSTGEQLMAALVLNRPDWLAEWDYTIAEALDRVSPEWVSLIPRVAQLVRDAQDRDADAAEVASKALAIARAKASGESMDRGIHCAATLVTYGEAPGYRNASFIFDLLPVGAKAPFRVHMSTRPEDGEPIVRHLRDVHRLAWHRGEPLDVQPGEARPRWID